MRKYNFIWAMVLNVILTMGCGNTSTDQTEKPGPVTESDKSRYNLNPTDELRYGTLDSANQDSTDTVTDSINYKR